MLKLGKLSVGMGDRFGRQAEAQLRACFMAEAHGVHLVPVWNKSNREHLISGSEPASVRAAAEAAVKKLDWKSEWHVDADHIRLETVDRFIAASDFFTIDVADSIGKTARTEITQQFLHRHAELIGRPEIPGIASPFTINRAAAERSAQRYLSAVSQAGAVYRHVERAKGKGTFIAEISLDETDQPQTAVELLIILVALGDEGVPVQTIAPKFTGQFSKGVDYAGEPAAFEREFNDDLCVIKYAIKRYGLPANLKLSVHSGSDKFSIYPCIRRVLEKHSAGVHLKTAGTSWLEELIGLAEAGGEGLDFVKEVYIAAFQRIDELCAPYITVLEIDRAKLPPGPIVVKWTSEQFLSALRHDQACAEFNPHLRQLLHVAFRIAAEQRARYLELIREHHSIIARNVTANLFDRHIRPIFIGNE